MQLTPETMAEIGRIFDDPEPSAPDALDETRFVDDELYGTRAPRLVEVRVLTWLAYDDDCGDDDSRDQL